MTRVANRVWLARVSALAIALSFPGFASAGPDTCSLSGTAETCSGNQSDGILLGLLGPPQLTSLTISNLTSSISPTSTDVGVQYLSLLAGNPGAAITGFAPLPLLVTTDGSQSITASSANFGTTAVAVGINVLTESGAGGDGALALPDGSFTPLNNGGAGGNGGDVTVNNLDNITADSSARVAETRAEEFGEEGELSGIPGDISEINGWIAGIQNGSIGPGDFIYAYLQGYYSGLNIDTSTSSGLIDALQEAITNLQILQTSLNGIPFPQETSQLILGGISVTSIGGNGGTAYGLLGTIGYAHVGVGGAGGTGGTITITNDATIQATGPLVAGIFAESIGGNGGDSPSPEQDGPGDPNAGFGGQAGMGGTITVTNSGTIVVTGDSSTGIFAESLGGLAGEGGPPGDSNPNYTPAGGTGGLVTVNNPGVISTNGVGAYGIFAESLGGAGISGGDAKAGGAGGNVVVDVSGQITTAGDYAYGVFGRSVGGAGGNTFYINSTTTTVDDSAGSSDTAYSSVSFALPQNVDTLHLFGQGLTGTANDQGDTIFGDPTFASTLIGGGGSDYLAGGAGNDVIEGGTGPDLMFGGGGANRFVFKATADAPIGANLTTIGDFSDGVDEIDLSAIKTTGANPGQNLTFIGTAAFSDVAGQVRYSVSGSNTIVQGDVNGDGTADFEIQLNNTSTLQASDFMLSPACYRGGTRILTDRGEVQIDDLAIGDGIVTISGDVRPVKWIGYRSIDCSRQPDPRAVWPVLVRTGAFGELMPHRDLFLSPDHAVFVDDVLIPIRLLINGTTIDQVAANEVTYYHVELPRHDVLIAEGLPAESYLDTGNRELFANGGGATRLRPSFDVPKTWYDDAAAPLAVDEARVRPVWERLVARSDMLGKSVPALGFTSDPAVHLRVNGRIIWPVVSDHLCFKFLLPKCTGTLHLVSRSAYLTDSRPWADDRRQLGICVNRVVWHDSDGPHDLPLDHPETGEGWWEVETTDHFSHRWTNGDAVLPPLRNAIILEVRLVGILPYRIDSTEPRGLSVSRAA